MTKPYSVIQFRPLALPGLPWKTLKKKIPTALGDEGARVLSARFRHMEYRVKPHPSSCNGPTVQCSIEESPYLLGRSYVSTFVDQAGQPIPVIDTGRRPSQKKRRKLARQRRAA